MTSITTHKVTRIAHCDMCGKKMRTTRALEATVRCQLCRQQAPLITPRQRDNRQWREMDCPTCGVSFSTKQQLKTYCTKKCSRHAKDEHSTCNDCGTTLGDRRATRCTPCAQRRRHGWNGGKELVLLAKVKQDRAWPSHRIPPRPAPFRARTCRVCSQPFLVYGELWQSSTCSTDCATQETSRVKYEAKLRRRLRMRTTRIEPIYKQRVFADDRYTCYLCHEPLAMDQQVPHSKAPTLDHVLPLARGGTHTYDNLRASCYECNWRKADKTNDEFLSLTRCDDPDTGGA